MTTYAHGSECGHLGCGRQTWTACGALRWPDHMAFSPESDRDWLPPRSDHTARAT